MPNSPIVLEVDDWEREHEVRRTRSGGHLDYLQEQERWNRRDQERQMVQYRGRKHYGATHQRIGGDRLEVPTAVYKESQKHRRARSDVGVRTEDLSRPFHTLEVTPRHELNSGRTHRNDSILDEGIKRASTHSRPPTFERPPKDKLPPIIVQNLPPVSDKTEQKSARSPSGGPRSPGGPPQLQYKYLVLQNKLADVCLACVRYIDVEAACPQDLTFEKISEQVKGLAFDLRTWAHIANIENMVRRDVPKDAVAVIDAATRNLNRLIERATELYDACSKAKPSDLKFQGLPKIDDEDDMFGEVDDQQSEQDPTESVGYVINASLHSIKLQIQSLKSLNRSLQEATPNAKDEMNAVSSLVKEVDRYFGTEAALVRNQVDQKFSGRRALEEARFAAAR